MYKATVDWNFKKKKERKKGNGEEKEERGLGSQSNRQMLLIRGDTVRRG